MKKRKKGFQKNRVGLVVVISALLVLSASAQLLPISEFVEDVFANTPAETPKPPEDTTFVVALDAGHGGADGGADELLLEKNMTQTVVGFLEEYLLKDENYTPVLCRTSDDISKITSIDERCEVAKNANAKLLLSVHANTDPTRTAYGFECFPAPPGREYHEKSLEFAQIIAAKFGEAGQRLRGERGVRYKYYEELSNGKTKEIIAEESITEVNNAKSFGMVERAGCPAVLAEQFFLTSNSDTDTWGSEAGCKKAAQIYYAAICDYFGTTPII